MRNTTLTDVFLKFEEFIKNNTFCLRIGKIVSVSAKSAVVDLINNEGQIHDVPFCTSYGNRQGIPLKAGDTVLVGFIDTSFFKWLKTGVDEQSTATHSKANAIIISSIFNEISSFTNSQKITFKDDVVFEKPTNFQEITTFEKATTFKEAVIFEKGVTFKEDVLFEKNITAQNISAVKITTKAGIDLATHTHSANGTPPTPQP